MIDKLDTGKLSGTAQPTNDQLELAKALHIEYCYDLVIEGAPWEVPTEEAPQYFETLKEAIVFLVNLGEPKQRAGAAQPATPEAKP